MKIEVIQPNELATAHAQMVFIDCRSFGGFFVAKNAYGTEGFMLPEKYFGEFILSPDSVPSFYLVKAKTPETTGIVTYAAPALPLPAETAEKPVASTRPPV